MSQNQSPIVRQPTKPVKLQKKKRVAETRQRVMGVDPGLAETGVVIVERDAPGQPIRVVAVQMVSTKIAPIKGRSKLRITVDDQRRYKEIQSGLDRIYHEFLPYAVGVEIYVHNPKQRGSNQGLKTMGVYVGMLFWGHTRGLFTSAFLASDLKRRFCGKLGASKAAVGKVVCEQVAGLWEMVKLFPKNSHEHLLDAAGHAILILEETDSVRHMLGI